MSASPRFWISQQFLEGPDLDPVSTDSENTDRPRGVSTDSPQRQEQVTAQTRHSGGPPLTPLHNPYLLSQFYSSLPSPFLPRFPSLQPFPVKQSSERPAPWKVSCTRNYYFYALSLRVDFSTIHTFVGIFFLEYVCSQNMEPASRKLNRTREAMCPTIKRNTSSSNRHPPGHLAVPREKRAAGNSAKCP